MIKSKRVSSNFQNNKITKISYTISEWNCFACSSINVIYGTWSLSLEVEDVLALRPLSRLILMAESLSSSKKGPDRAWLLKKFFMVDSRPPFVETTHSCTLDCTWSNFFLFASKKINRIWRKFGLQKLKTKLCLTRQSCWKCLHWFVCLCLFLHFGQLLHFLQLSQIFAVKIDVWISHWSHRDRSLPRGFSHQSHGILFLDQMFPTPSLWS